MSELVESLLSQMDLDEVRHIRGRTYKDKSTVIVVPMRGVEQHTHDQDCQAGDHKDCLSPFIHAKVVKAWTRMIAPINQKRAMMFVTGHEVGQAYEAAIRDILNDPELSRYKYVLSLEEDNLPPADAQVRLLDTIEDGCYDAVAGLYWMKSEYSTPMAYGNPAILEPEIDFAPRDVSEGGVIEVNGFGMGCTLFRLDLFRQVDPPWFVTVCETDKQGDGVWVSQDLFFCERARKAGKKFAVDCDVRVGHMNLLTGEIF